MILKASQLETKVDIFIFTEMPLELLQCAEEPILYENDSILTCVLLKPWNDLLMQKTLTAFTIDST